MLKADYYMNMNDEIYFVELHPDKPMNSLPNTIMVNVFNTNTGILSNNKIVHTIDIKPIRELGILAEVLYT